MIPASKTSDMNSIQITEKLVFCIVKKPISAVLRPIIVKAAPKLTTIKK